LQNLTRLRLVAVENKCTDGKTRGENHVFFAGTLCAQREGMNGAELRARVKRFAIRIVKCVRAVPRDDAAREIGYQLLKAGTGESDNYHSACRGRSKKEFIAKLGTVVEEADEAEHWLDVVKQAELASEAELSWLVGEASELRAIFKASLTTARSNCERDEGRRARKSSNPQIRKSRNQQS
jgi:four helix bundle protein